MEKSLKLINLDKSKTHSLAGKPVYRPDIDGLRAVAVLAVVIFHFRESFLPNGYLGVDIFFVLSGYLITSIIVREMNSGKFTILGFYERRIRRILPALIAVLAVTTVFSVAVLLPADLVGYGKSLVSTLGFVSNIYFWRDTNYFAPDAATKPLLHMWSLAVEEQFYIFYPIFLMFALKFMKKWVIWLVLFIGLFSFTLNFALNYIGGGSPAFFMFPTRAWQLLVGGVLALMPNINLGAGLTRCASVLGALLVLAGLALPIADYLGNVPTGTLVVLGTALLLFAGIDQLSDANRLLSLAPLCSIGKVSYSLYLVHWPMVVLWQYYQVGPLTGAQIVAAFAMMIALAYASTYFIEQPARSRNMPIRRLLLILGAAVTLMVMVSVGLIWSKGLPQRLDAKAAAINAAVGTNYRCPISKMLNFGIGRACELNLPSRDLASAEVVLMGNSHAQMYAPLWENILQREGKLGLLVPQNGCLPTTEFNLSNDCITSARSILEHVKELHSVKLVILGFNWDLQSNVNLVTSNGKTVTGPYQRKLKLAIDDLINELQSSGKTVILTGPIVIPGIDIASETSRQLAFGRPVTNSPYVARTDFDLEMGELVSHFSNRKDIGFVRPDKVQCDDKRCYFIRNGKSLFADSNHLATWSLEQFETEFLPVYRKMVAQSAKH